jgi:hypothetical protein
MSKVVGTLLADTTLVRLFTTHNPPYINITLGLQAFFSLLKPRGLDQQVVLKDQKEITTTRCTITQRSAKVLRLMVAPLTILTTLDVGCAAVL